MKLKSFKFFFSVSIILLFTSILKGEEKIDIWKNTKEKKNNVKIETDQNFSKEKNINIQTNSQSPLDQKIKIEENLSNDSEEAKVFGIYDPSQNDFDLNMWSPTKAEDVRASLKRIKKMKLSKTSNEILESILMSFSFPPQGMDEKEFANLKISWLIENNRSELIESFLNQNKNFNGKKKAVQFLVDQNIAQANLKQGCEKIEFIDTTIKDPYLEKFKIYCLVFNKKNSQAQLLLNLLREQKQSDKFFDDKIDFLLGISEKTSDKINEKNLLNFYLSSVTIKNFNYETSKKTKKEIWQYLNAANLIKIDDINDKQKLKSLELAANEGQIDDNIIFDIYKQMSFNLSTLINAKNIYQTLDESDARSLIYQKYLLSESTESKLEYLFLLDELFHKNDLKNIHSSLLSNAIQEIGIDNIPENYKEISKSKILNEEKILGKIKYNDKVLHQSKIIKFYIEGENEKKTQKDLDKILKKINKNKKYFFSAKDIALVESLSRDGIKIPENFKYKEIAEKYDIPKNLLQLSEKKQKAFLALKIVEIIGEDEPYQLDPETIYFITNLLNRTDLINIRNKVLISALPQRT